MQLTPGTCYQIHAHAIPFLQQQFGDYIFIVVVIHANDTSDSVVFEFKKILGAISPAQIAATQQVISAHADGAVLQDITGKALNHPAFEKESVFKAWIQAGIATPCDCNG
ncbi:hypothetical protein [Chitinophaga nivalis]|uniref:Uncharacterized protein n=1 Tax=Chitinophaga nivalis TaxID=2991709 RepID=A0ABT3IWB2_9BACT|nr:hypothetical protein [Chitinophaga nivalis]MCW3462027.1 hypothetical protein [Chitinophaga nivalis]MCW3488281.1 hypothetical protein [Chitinophaga nivalis]